MLLSNLKGWKQMGKRYARLPNKTLPVHTVECRSCWWALSCCCRAPDTAAPSGEDYNKPRSWAVTVLHWQWNSRWGVHESWRWQTCHRKCGESPAGGTTYESRDQWDHSKRWLRLTNKPGARCASFISTLIVMGIIWRPKQRHRKTHLFFFYVYDLNKQTKLP